MTDLISRRAAIKAIDDLPNCYNGYSDTYDKACIIGVLEELPTTEPKRGKWEHHIGIGNVALMKCGECGFTYPELLGMMLFNFCPNCGARMSDECAD